MQRTDTIIVGAGQAGLAVSNLLTGAGRDHVLLERGRIGERWRSERWDSLRLLTPNWMTRLPRWQYSGDNPDGFMRHAEVVDFFDRYRGRSVHPSVARHGSSAFRPSTADITSRPTRAPGTPRTSSSQPARPIRRTCRDGRRRSRPASSRSRRTGTTRRRPCTTAGSSSSVRRPPACSSPTSWRRAGRSVVLAVGTHTRGVRSYRGLDMFRWLEATGKNATPLTAVADPASAPRAPSLQLVGGASPREVDLRALQERGVELTGRAIGADRSTRAIRR